MNYHRIYQHIGWNKDMNKKSFIFFSVKFVRVNNEIYSYETINVTYCVILCRNLIAWGWETELKYSFHAVYLPEKKNKTTSQIHLFYAIFPLGLKKFELAILSLLTQFTRFHLSIYSSSNSTSIFHWGLTQLHFLYTISKKSASVLWSFCSFFFLF